MRLTEYKIMLSYKVNLIFYKTRFTYSVLLGVQEVACSSQVTPTTTVKGFLIG